MRYSTQCKEQKKYFGFFARLTDGDETALYDQTYDRALVGTGRRAISNRVLLMKLMTHYLATIESTGHATGGVR
jgi:hypothetical protein